MIIQQKKGFIHWSLFLSSLILLWLLAVRQLSLEWTVNPLYQYGWWVIPLAVYLFIERIPDFPQPERPSNQILSRIIWLVFIVCYIPLRIIQEANTDWIFLNWVFSLFAITITLGLLHEIGGRSWLFHFGFPILFVLSSIPWPVGIENLILQSLMRVNAIITAAVLSLGSMSAVAKGNIIEIGGQFIGVEEACSGIRSLQTSLMMSLFLGEFYRIKPLSRLWLLLLSFFLAFIFNSSRTIVLTFVGATEGLPALESWHDPLGYGVLIITLIGLWGTAYWFSMDEEVDEKERSASKNYLQQWTSQIHLPKSTLKVMSAFLIAALLGEVGTEAWYRARERALLQATDFTVNFPEQAKFYQEEEFSEITKTILKYNSSKGASWKDETGSFWRIYLLEWEPGRVSKKLVSAHTPDVCYPAAGFSMESFLGYNSIIANGVPINFRTYLFRQEDSFFYVFHGIWEEKVSRADTQLEMEVLNRKQRLKTVIEGKRNLGQKILGVSVLGPTTIEEAKLQLTDTLSNIITPTNDKR